MESFKYGTRLLNGFLCLVMLFLNASYVLVRSSRIRQNVGETHASTEEGDAAAGSKVGEERRRPFWSTTISSLENSFTKQSRRPSNDSLLNDTSSVSSFSQLLRGDHDRENIMNRGDVDKGGNYFWRWLLSLIYFFFPFTPAFKELTPKNAKSISIT